MKEKAKSLLFVSNELTFHTATKVHPSSSYTITKYQKLKEGDLIYHKSKQIIEDLIIQITNMKILQSQNIYFPNLRRKLNLDKHGKDMKENMNQSNAVQNQ